MAEPKSTIPEEVFHAIATLVPRLIYIAEKECGLEPIELLALWHVRHFGRPDAERNMTILRQELTRMLTQKFRFSDAAVSKMLAYLQEEGLVLRTTVSGKQRLELFGSEDGSKLVVVLTGRGNQQIDQFKNRLRRRWEAWLSRQTRTNRLAVRAVFPIVVQFARWLVKRYKPHRQQVLYGADPNSAETD